MLSTYTTPSVYRSLAPRHKREGLAEGCSQGNVPVNRVHWTHATAHRNGAPACKTECKDNNVTDIHQIRQMVANEISMQWCSDICAFLVQNSLFSPDFRLFKIFHPNGSMHCTKHKWASSRSPKNNEAEHFHAEKINKHTQNTQHTHSNLQNTHYTKPYRHTAIDQHS